MTMTQQQQQQEQQEQQQRRGEICNKFLTKKCMLSIFFRYLYLDRIKNVYLSFVCKNTKNAPAQRTNLSFNTKFCTIYLLFKKVFDFLTFGT